LVSTTVRGTSPPATELLGGAFDADLGSPESERPICAMSLETMPPALINVPAEDLSEELALCAAFVLSDALRLTDQVRGNRELGPTPTPRSPGGTRIRCRNPHGVTLKELPVARCANPSAANSRSS